MKTTTMDLYKLMVLYLLGKADYPLTNARISDFMLLKDYASYFSLQTVLSELTESGFIQAETIRNRSFFELTKEGKTTLPYFLNNLNSTIKEEIDSYIESISKDIIKDKIATASYVKNDNSDYTVNLKINEYKSSLLNLSIMVPSEEIASNICKSWEERYEGFYGTLLNLLTEPENPQ